MDNPWEQNEINCSTKWDKPDIKKNYKKRGRLNNQDISKVRWKSKRG